MKVNHEELDPNIVSMVKALNRFPGIHTTSSCEGHEIPPAERRWNVFVTPNRFEDTFDPKAWIAIEYLAYLFTKVVSDVKMSVIAGNPFLNGFGDSLDFAIEGSGDPNKVAEIISAALDEILVDGDYFEGVLN